ncbi:MAG: tetratricopeptide repeat protein [Deltaproteobacteria bacterium]|nr:tetratricopeptide repeat protein [Deltaproteobacteria bacterium]
MSSIYDALKRVQDAGSGAQLSTPGQSSKITRSVLWIVIAAVAVSSAITAAVLYGIMPKHNDGIQVESLKVPSSTVQVDLKQIHSPQKNAAIKQADVEVQSAISRYTEILEKTPDQMDAYIKLAKLYYDRRDYDQAQQIYTRALRYFKNDARLLNNMGSVLIAKGELGSAIEHFMRAHKVSKEFVEPVYNLACAYARQGDESKALHYLKSAIELNAQVKLWAADDPDFSLLHNNSAFDELTAGR